MEGIRVGEPSRRDGGQVEPHRGAVDRTAGFPDDAGDQAVLLPGQPALAVGGRIARQIRRSWQREVTQPLDDLVHQPAGERQGDAAMEQDLSGAAEPRLQRGAGSVVDPVIEPQERPRRYGQRPGDPDSRGRRDFESEPQPPAFRLDPERAGRGVGLVAGGASQGRRALLEDLQPGQPLVDGKRAAAQVGADPEERRLDRHLAPLLVLPGVDAVERRGAEGDRPGADLQGRGGLRPGTLRGEAMARTRVV